MELQIIENKIYEFRGYKVMIDFDLAEMYGIETAQLKRSVRRNIDRFEGEDFMFELTKEEISRCHFGTLIKGRGHNIKYLPFAFTELGISMLSSVLGSETAIKINRNIMRAFVAMRHLVLTPANNVRELQYDVKELKRYIEEVFTDYNDINEDTRMQIELINESLAELHAKKELLNKPRNLIGYTSPLYQDPTEK
jgi:phage regulator Rha-like protein